MEHDELSFVRWRRRASTFRRSNSMFVFMILPILINVILAALTQVILRSTRISKVQKNASVCMYIVLICVNVQCTHYVFGTLLASPKRFAMVGKRS